MFESDKNGSYETLNSHVFIGYMNLLDIALHVIHNALYSHAFLML